MGIQGDLGLDPTTLPQGSLTTTYLHSVGANPEGTTAYLSYWDAGVLMLDISDIANPVYLGRTTYAAAEEGNAHSTSVAKSGNLLLVNDEDFNPIGAVLEVDSPSDLAGPVVTLEQRFGRPICTVGPIGAEAAYLGQACTRETFVTDPTGKIAIAEMSGCPARDKVLAAQQAGARALLLISNFPTRLVPLPGDSRDISIPVVVIPLRQGRQMRAALNRGQRVSLRLGPEPNGGWGFLRIFDTSRVQEPKQISTFATENSRRCPQPDGGIYSIHNTVVVGDTVYASWYSDGVRVIDLSNAANPREVGFYVPSDKPDRTKTSTWGVFAANDLVYLSDITTGLHILRRTPQ
ncbi:MAG: PA domain-containing protein [Bryobacteraceae bacterium]